MRVELNGCYAYEAGDLELEVGDVVEVPTVGWLRDVKGPTSTFTVTSLTTEYDGPCTRILRVKKKGRQNDQG